MRPEKRVLMVSVLYFVVLLGIAYAGYVTGLERLQIAEKVTEAEKKGFFELPTVVVNVNGLNESATAVKIDITVKVAPEDIPLLKGYKPVMIDRIQQYINKIDIEDLKNTNNLSFLREDFVYQLNQVTQSVRVIDVIIRKLVVETADKSIAAKY